MRFLDAIRERWWRDDVEARRDAHEHARAAVGVPFSQREVELLAFGLVHEWPGATLTRERWRARGAPVCRAWAARVKAERVECARARRPAPVRPQPWPVALHGLPPRPGA